MVYLEYWAMCTYVFNYCVQGETDYSIINPEGAYLIHLAERSSSHITHCVRGVYGIELSKSGSLNKPISWYRSYNVWYTNTICHGNN